MSKRSINTVAAGLLALLAGLLGSPGMGQVVVQDPPGYSSLPNPVATAGINNGTTGGGAAGSWVFGSTSGDPARTEDDNFPLIEMADAFLYLADTGTEIPVTPTTGAGDDYRLIIDGFRQTVGYDWTRKETDSDLTIKFRMHLIRGTARWTYSITNNDTSTARIGFRVKEKLNYLDSKVGGPYYVPTLGMLNTVQEFVGSNVPTEWSIRYTPSDISPADIGYTPLLRARQPMNRAEGVTPPDRFVIAEDDDIDAYTWEIIDNPTGETPPPDKPFMTGMPYMTTTGGVTTGSMAAGLYYAPKSLMPGQTMTIVGQIGYDWAHEVINDKFGTALAVAAPEWVGYRSGDNLATPTVESGYYEPDTIDIRSYIMNSTFENEPTVSVTIDPGSGLSLVSGQPPTYSFTAAALRDYLCRKSDLDQYSWKLRPNGTAFGMLPVRITATFSPGAAVTNMVYVNVPALPSKTFTQGDYLIGFPFAFDDPLATNALGLGPLVQLAWWNPSLPSDANGSKYLYASRDSVQLAPGRAYWLRLGGTTTVNLQDTTPVDQRKAYRVQLGQGWNMISNPYQFSISWGKCRVYYDGTEYSLADAIRLSYIRAEIWTWDPATSQYTPGSQYGVELKPYQGYWLYAYNAVSLTYEPNPFVAAMDPTLPGARRIAGPDQWQVNLITEAGGARDAQTTFGIGPEEADGLSTGDRMKPPVSPMGLSTAFIHPDWGRAAGNYAVDLQAPGASKSWRLEVLATKPNTPVTLRWPDLTEVPAGTSLLLTDEVTGVQVSMRTSPGYTFNSGSGGFRRFTIVAGGTTPRLQFTQVRAVPDRASGATITYGVTIPAELRVQIYTPTGRLVRSLTPTRASGTLSSINWDGHSATGGLLPRGLYLCHLRAESTDGQVVRWVISLPLR